jgi:pimeloyl-ACP methyl ester carboxylesterase
MPKAGDIYYRQIGAGEPPVVVLHGGWGYEFYPFDDAIAGVPRRFVIPDRTGYGKSAARSQLPVDFHTMYARETEAFLDELGVDRCVVWGHSDGAVIAVHLALANPARAVGVILESLHVDREKPRSREFFTMMAENPDGFGERVATKLEAEHGPFWRDIIQADGLAWLEIAKQPGDLFGGRLSELRVPTLALFGTDDPRTEPGEIEQLQREVPHAEIQMIEGATHSPHSERASAGVVTARVKRFLGRLAIDS